MTRLEVLPAEGRRMLKQFIALPYRLYRHDPYWVPPVWMDYRRLFQTHTHPFCAHAELECFLARRDREVVGRIAAIIDYEFNRLYSERAGFFGFFESIDEPEVANRLLAAAWDWLRQRGARYIRGPMNPSANYECGLLVDGFDTPPKVMMSHNPPYYGALLEGAGFKRVKDLFAYYLHRNNLQVERAACLAEKAIAVNHIQIRPVRLKEFDSEVELIFRAYNSAWSENWGFVPPTREEWFFLARELKPIAVPELVLLAEVSGSLAGFAFALPDINQALRGSRRQSVWWNALRLLWRKRSITSMRVVLLGIQKAYRGAGVGAALYAEIVRQGIRLGYQDCEMSWILDDNVLMQRSIELLGGKRYKTYRLYQRE